MRYDLLFATLCGIVDPSGQDGLRERDRNKACAGKSTLNRLEICEGFWQMTRTKKIVAEWAAIETLLVKSSLNGYPERPKQIVLDLDVTANELRDEQEGRFFYGHCDCHCYLPLDV